jgi:hypothetical protein
MMTFRTFDDDFSGPEPLMRALDATPCRRALLAHAGHVGPSPELIAHRKREAERLRQAAFRRVGRRLVAAVRKLFR